MTHSDKDTWQQWPDEQDQPTISDPSVDLNVAETPPKCRSPCRRNDSFRCSVRTTTKD